LHSFATFGYSEAAPTDRGDGCTTYDHTAPTITSLIVPARAIPGFVVTWSAQDNLIGVSHYDVQYASESSGWTDWLVSTPVTQALFTGPGGHVYTFRVSATDGVGNESDWQTSGQVTVSLVKKYYAAAGRRVAMRSDGVVYYLHGDHLGSTSLVTTGAGAEVARQLYLPYGAPRWGSGTLPTDYRYTGQRSEEASLGSLYDYGARYYSPVLGRFLSADTMVPGAADGTGGGAATLGYDPKTRLTPLTTNMAEFASQIGEENREIAQYGWFFQWDEEVREKHNVPMGPTNPQALNRYAYVLNNPLKYTDPTGHCPWCKTVGNVLSLVATALDITASGLSFSGVLIEATASAMGTAIPLPGGGTAIGLGAGVVLYSQLNVAENAIGVASFFATAGADIFNRETYIQTAQLPNMRQGTEVVFGQDTLVSLIDNGLGLVSPEAVSDTALNGGLVAYDIGRLNGTIPTYIKGRIGVDEYGFWYTGIAPEERKR